MLQTIRSHTQGWLAWVLILLLAFVFALWGIGGYLMQNPNETVIAKVNGQEITSLELQQVYDRYAQQSQMAQVMAGIVNPVINEELLRKQAIESLVLENLLTQTAKKQGFWVSLEQVNDILIRLPQFQVNGQFSAAVYERLLRQMNYTPQSFRHAVQNELLITQAQSTVRESVFLLPYQVDSAVSLINQTRDIRYVLLNTASFKKDIQITDEDLQAYYNGHQSEFMSPETVTVSYVLLDKDTLAEQIKSSDTPTEQQLREYYEVNLARYTSPEQRSAKHILLTVSPEDTPDEVNQIKAKADELMGKIKAGESFETLAQDYSQDPGSASLGGDLGYFGRGEMVPQFEEAVYSAQAGEVVGPIKTDFGYHLIKVEDVQAAVQTPFADVKDTLAKQWLEDKALDQFEAELSEIDQAAFEQPESLDHVASQFDLPLQTMVITTNFDSNPELAKNKAVLEAALSEDVLYGRNNSEIIRLSPTKALVLRVTDHQKPALMPFDAVKNDLKAVMMDRQALRLARDKARSVYESYQQGESLDAIAKTHNLTFEVAKGIDRQYIELPDAVVNAAFAQPVSNKPAMTAIDVSEEQVALIVVDSIHPGQLDKDFAQTMMAEFKAGLTQFYGERDYHFYLTQARNQADIKVEE